MTSLNITNARRKLYKIVQEVNESHEPIHISGKNSSAVIIGEDDWNSIQETLHLAEIPGMHKSIIEGMNQPLSELSDKLDW